MYVRKSSKKRKYLIVKLLGTSSSDGSLYVFRCRCSGCINRWDVLITGNLVLRLKQTSTSKLEPPWEGPYLVHEVIPGGAYRLRNPKTGMDVENPWNAAQLRRFYP
jgi:hypothetical protein